MPGSILGIGNHLALAIDVAIQYIYVPTAAACMSGGTRTIYVLA